MCTLLTIYFSILIVGWVGRQIDKIKEFYKDQLSKDI